MRAACMDSSNCSHDGGGGWGCAVIAPSLSVPQCYPLGSALGLRSPHVSTAGSCTRRALLRRKIYPDCFPGIIYTLTPTRLFITMCHRLHGTLQSVGDLVHSSSPLRGQPGDGGWPCYYYKLSRNLIGLINPDSLYSGGRDKSVKSVL